MLSDLIQVLHETFQQIWVELRKELMRNGYTLVISTYRDNISKLRLRLNHHLQHIDETLVTKKIKHSEIYKPPLNKRLENTPYLMQYHHHHIHLLISKLPHILQVQHLNYLGDDHSGVPEYSIAHRGEIRVDKPLPLIQRQRL